VAGARIIEWVAEFFLKALGKDVAADTGKAAERKLEQDLFAFGRKEAPRLPRPEQDFHVPSAADPIGPYSPKAPTDNVPGASTFTDPQHPDVPLSGQYHKLPAGYELPQGLGIHADGQDVGGTAPWGHRTIYPTHRMTVQEFQKTWEGLPWDWAGKRK